MVFASKYQGKMLMGDAIMCAGLLSWKYRKWMGVVEKYVETQYIHHAKTLFIDIGIKYWVTVN